MLKILYAYIYRYRYIDKVRNPDFQGERIQIFFKIFLYFIYFSKMLSKNSVIFL